MTEPENYIERKDNMKKLFSMFLVALLFVSSLCVTASAAINAWNYEALNLYQSGTTVRTNPHSTTRAQVQMHNYTSSNQTVYVAVEMVTGGSFVKYGTVSVPVGGDNGTNIIDSPTGSAVNTRGVVWAASTGARASGDMGYWQ